MRELLPAFDWPEHRHGTVLDHRRSLQAIDLELRPIHHWTETRVWAHVFICMLAAYLVWHLRQAWAPLTFTDEHRAQPVCSPRESAIRCALVPCSASAHHSSGRLVEGPVIWLIEAHACIPLG